MHNSTSSCTPVRANPLRLVSSTQGMRQYVDNKQFYLLAKRVFDILFALSVIVFVLSWLMPVTCLLIFIDSKGPLFFVQKRVGKTGKSFFCLKFRTMVVNPNCDQLPAGDNDERITRLGKHLRRLNIDELPQFINVLFGDMSVVGPRPHMFADCHRFSALIPEYKLRNIVRPGLTGLAQVKGYRGPAFSNEAVCNRYYCDRYYVKHFSLALDLRIIIQTVIQRIMALVSMSGNVKTAEVPDELLASSR